MAKNASQAGQIQILEAIEFLKAVRKQAPEENLKLIDALDRTEKYLHDELFQYVNQRLRKASNKKAIVSIEQK